MVGVVVSFDGMLIRFQSIKICLFGLLGSFKVSVPTGKKILVARVFSLQRQVIYQIKAKRSHYLITDFISSNFKRRLSFLLSNSNGQILAHWPMSLAKRGTVFVCPQFPYRGNDMIFWIFPIVPSHAFCM